MNDWVDKSVAILTTDNDKVWSGTLVHSDATGVVISVVNKEEATGPFAGLSEESEIQVYIPIFRIRYLAHGEFQGIS